MNPAVQCIILLACVATCTSSTFERCSCIKASKAVNPSLIVEVKQYNPRPYCNKQEVIVRLRDNSLRCLDPNSAFTKKVLQRVEMKRAASMTVSPKTTIVAPTASTVSTNHNNDY